MPKEVKEYKNGWHYAGGGGIDTSHFCKKGFCLTIPGIRQILKYGKFNLEWWGKYIFYLTNIKP